MKFKNYLNEEIKLNKIDETIEFIQKNCKLYLKDGYKSGTGKQYKPLYTGRKLSEDFIIKKVRKDRKPLDTDKGIHDFGNDIFYDKFKIKLRSESIFCASSISFISNYGRSFLIFPIGKYEIYGNPEIEDLYSTVIEDEQYMEYYDGEIHGVDRDGLNKRFDAEEEFFNLMGKYKKGDLKGAIESGNEVMMVTDKVVLINRNYSNGIYDMMGKSNGKF